MTHPTSNLGSLREYAKAALSPSNAQFYTSCADEIERLRSENATLTAVCSLWGLNPDPEHETNATRAALLSGDSKPSNQRPFSLWSFLRQVLHQGESIGLDYRERPYEEYSARMDAAAREREEQLRKALRLTDETPLPALKATTEPDARWADAALTLARQYDQGSGGTFEFDSTTLLRLLREARGLTQPGNQT